MKRAENDGTNATYTAPNFFVVGDVVTITDNTNAAFNVVGTVTAATATTFTVANATVGSGVGGSAVFAFAPAYKGNYDITWSPGPDPIDDGFVGGPFPTPGNKYYNLSLRP